MRPPHVRSPDDQDLGTSISFEGRHLGADPVSTSKPPHDSYHPTADQVASEPAARPSARPGRLDFPSNPLDFPEEIGPGQIVLGKYRVERRLGEGGMGTVWLLRHKHLSSTYYALKLIIAKHALDRTARELFRREALTNASIDHPNAVRVFDYDADPRIAYILMEFLKGHTLEAYLGRQPKTPMPMGFVRLVLEQLCCVLQHIHDRAEPIIHRDLKPSNLMLIDDASAPDRGLLKVLDFGIAKWRTAAELSSEASGFRTGPGVARFTAAYASPEQCRSYENSGEGGEAVEIDYRSDLYSVGVILYQMLTGYLPFSGNWIKLIYAHQSLPPPPFAERNPAARVSQEIERLVMSCLAKDPARRPQSADAIISRFLLELSDQDAADVGDYPVPHPTGGGWASGSLSGFPNPGTGLSSRTPVSGPGTTQPTTGPRTLTGEVRRPGRRRLIAAMMVVSLCVATAAGWRMLWPAVSPPPREDPGKSKPGDLGNAAKLSDGPKNPPELVPAKPKVSQEERVKIWLERIYPKLQPEKKNDDVPKNAQGLPLVLVWKEPDWADADAARFILVEGGEFTMGPEGNIDGLQLPEDQLPPKQHQVERFYMMQTEVTNRQFDAYCEHESVNKGNFPLYKTSPSAAILSGPWKGHKDGYPATGIGWEWAERFASFLHGSLPTEAQWEYAARSRGKRRPYTWGKDSPTAKRVVLAGVPEFGDQPQPAGAPCDDETEQGILGMMGNVREWCRDPYVGKPDHVLRGGSWYTNSTRVSVYGPRHLYDGEIEDERLIKEFGTRENYGGLLDTGFRVVLEPDLVD